MGGNSKNENRVNESCFQSSIFMSHVILMESRVYRDKLKFREIHQDLIVRRHGIEVSRVHSVVHFLPKSIHSPFKMKRSFKTAITGAPVWFSRLGL